MNIVVKTFGQKYIVRPDTTWERDNEDLYVPEFVNSLSYTPVLFARISKPGRSVGEKFAERYYDGIGFGVLLYPDNMMDGSAEGFACASCLDHSSFLPFPIYNKVTLGEPGNVFEMKVNDQTVFSYDQGDCGMIRKAIAEATRYIYIRTGDLIAIELDKMKPLCSGQGSRTSVNASWCGNPSFDFNVIM